MKTTTLTLILISAILSCGWRGCQTISDRIPLELKSSKEKEIAALKVDFNKKIEAKGAEITAIKDAIILAKNAQIQGGADAFYGQDFVFKTIITPTRTDLVTHNLGDEGWAALGRVMPTYEKMMEMNERLSKELDETKTSLADLQKSHDKAMNESQKLVDTTKHEVEKLTQALQEKDTLEKQYKDKLSLLQDQLNEANNKIIAIEKEKADNKAARQAQIAKLSWGAGVLAALCLAGAIWSPVFKRQLGIMAASFGAAAVALPFIEPWMVLAGFGVVILGVVVWIISEHNKADKATTAFANLIHEKPELVPDADAWTSKYVKDKDGNVTTVPDTAVQALVKSKLIANDKA